MKNKDALFQLIKSLSNNEKRYFTLFAARHIIGDKNNYLKLFEAIDKQKIYDEKKLAKLFAHTSMGDNLRMNRHYLYKLILKSMRSYRSEASIDAQLKGSLNDIEFLYEKGLYAQCDKILSKTKESAVKYEKYELLIEVLRWERNLLVMDSMVKDLRQRIEAIYEEQAAVLKKMRNITDYRRLADIQFSIRMLTRQTRNENEMQEFNTMMSIRLLQDEHYALTKEAKRGFYYINAAFHDYAGNYLKTYPYYKQMVELIESSPLQIPERPHIYIFGLYNLGRVACQLAMYDELFSVLKKMREIPENLGSKCSEGIKAEIFERSSLLELNMYIYTCNFEKAISLISEIEKGMVEFKWKIRKEFEISCFFDFAYFYVIQQEYNKALVWINKLINDAADTGARQDIYCITRILNLIIHYELGNEDVMEHLVKSTYRYLYKRNRLYKVETCILNFIRTKLLGVNPTRAGLTDVFKELKTELEEIIRDPFEVKFLENFDLVSWLESKIQNRPFAEIVRKRQMKFLKKELN